jgi:pterin-4a-carbinolamine dehydratase
MPGVESQSMAKPFLAGVLFFGLLTATAPAITDDPGIELDHVWIMVSLNAPERAALERAGFQLAREINHHEGTGTSSVTVEDFRPDLPLVIQY